MFRILVVIALITNSISAFAQPTERELLVKRLVRFQIVASQASYCKGELLKLGSTTETPVFLDPKDPVGARQRFSSNTLYSTEKAGYEEFTSYCTPVHEEYKKLANELGIPE